MQLENISDPSRRMEPAAQASRESGNTAEKLAKERKKRKRAERCVKNFRRKFKVQKKKNAKLKAKLEQMRAESAKQQSYNAEELRDENDFIHLQFAEGKGDNNVK